MNDTAFNTPTISIVTPSYNQGRFLSETIESVIGQAGDFLIDYIIVDGASTVRDYFRKLFKSRIEIMTGMKP